MIAAKDKAQELISKFFRVVDDNCSTSYNWGFSTAKECVLIFVDEMINQFLEMDNNVMGLQFNGKRQYWQQVKEEINSGIIYCPLCGNIWNTLKHNACQCGAQLKQKTNDIHVHKSR